MVKASTTTKRLKEIEGIQDSIRKLSDEYRNDFTEANALDPVVEKDLNSAVNALELVKGVYRAKRDS